MLKKIFTFCLMLSLGLAIAGTPGMKVGTPSINSLSVLSFNSEGILFIGDSYGGKVFAVDFGDNKKSDNDKHLSIADLEGDLASFLGTSPDNIMIHDMAVNPISQNLYLSVSRGRAKWSSVWETPNNLEKADILIRILPDGQMSEAKLENVEFSSLDLPSPIDAEKEHKWKKGVKLRSESITDIEFADGKVYVSGLSNEEFSSALWSADFPFLGDATINTLEIFHGAHGEWETASPVRSFLPMEINGKKSLLASYLCTPLVVLDLENFENKHVKGRTVAEMGAGNFPIDMVSYQSDGQDLVLMSNSALPLLIINPADVENYDGAIEAETKSYIEGIGYTPRSGTGIQQLADYNKNFILATQRQPNGKLALISISKSWTRP
ncbi:MAG: hypothetical protein Tsb0034_06980 [Ekhidna sp.]